MQVQAVNNQYNSPNFGIKYVDPRSWDPEVLDALMKSDLVKQIDSKYANAKVTYSSNYNRWLKEFVKKLNFQLDKTIEQKIYTEYNFEMIDAINTTSLEKLEQMFKEKQIEEKTNKQFAEYVYNAAEKSNAKSPDKTQEKETRKNIFEIFINLFK